MPLSQSARTGQPEWDALHKDAAEHLIHDRGSLDLLFSLTYEELRRIASSVKRNDPGSTLNPTALVNEAWLKLSHTPALGPISRLHFKRIVARAMRQLLVDAARRRHSQKRGGTDAIFVTFDESTDAPPVCGRDLIALDTALHELSCFEPRQAILIESRFFGGLSMSETAELLGVSEATLHRDWRVAKAWLAQAMQRLA